MTKKRLILIAALAIFCNSCTREPSEQITEIETEKAAEIGIGAIKGRLIVKLKEEPINILSISEIFEDSNNYRISRAFPDAGKFEERHRSYGLHLWYVVEFDEALSLTKAHKDFSAIPEIEIVEFDYKISELGMPFNDPGLNKQWHYNNDGNGSNSLTGSDMNAYEAWEKETGSPEVIVAVCDGGVDYIHEDLAANMWVNEIERNGVSGVDDDNNGYVDDIHGYNFTVIEGSNNMAGAITAESHGTHVAGTIGATNNNGVGVSGMAGGNGDPRSGVRIMSVQTSPGSAYIGAAIAYAADNGAVLINCSWELPGTTSTPAFLIESFRYFNETAGTDGKGNQTGPMKGGLIIFAAGNDSVQTGIPAQEDCVIAISSIGANFNKAYYSNFGDWVDFSATGGDASLGSNVYSTTPNNSYSYMQGTSMAAPHATGAAALVISRFKNQGFTREHLLHILNATANPIIYEYNTAYNGMMGMGLIDSGHAVNFNEGNIPPVDKMSLSSVANTVTVRWCVPGGENDNPVYQYLVFCSSSPLDRLDPARPGNGIMCQTINGSTHKPGSELECCFSNLEFERMYYIRIAGRGIYGNYSLSKEQSVVTVKNHAPVIEPVNGKEITLKSHESAVLKFKISDADDHKLNYKLSPETQGITTYHSGGTVNLLIDATKMESGRIYHLNLCVSDPFETVTEEIVIEILPNNPPEITGKASDIIFNSVTESKDLDLSGLFNDPDGEQLTYTYTLSPSGTLVKGEFNANNMRIYAFSYGSCSMTITANDASKDKVSLSFNILVRDGSKDVDLYPNPVKDNLNIRTTDRQSLSVRISNKAGIVTFSGSGLESGPFNPLKIDMSGMRNGLYYVKVSYGDKEETYSIIKK